jgi:hypothetical protein
MKNKVYEILKPLKYPVSWQIRPKLDNKNTIVISFHFFNEGNSLFGDGKSIKQGGAVQVDVFSLVDYTNAVNQIRQEMTKNKFRYYESYDDIEDVGNQQIYHKVILFNYDESEVR